MIPKVQPTEDQRKIKILNEEIERLNQLIATGGTTPEQNMDRSVPNHILFATAFIVRYQDSSSPKAIEVAPSQGDVDYEIVEREPMTEELMAVGAACDLLRDYFDSHNTRMLRQRTAANKKAKK